MLEPKDILVRSSKKLCLQAVNCAVESAYFLKELMDLAFKEEDEPFSHRAGWSMVYLSQQHPNLIRPHLRYIASKLPELKGHSQIASFLRIFDEVKYNHDDFGDVLDYCIHTIRMPIKREYVKVIALNILLEFGTIYPELASEIIEEIKLSQEHFEMNHCKKKAKTVVGRLEKVSSQ